MHGPTVILRICRRLAVCVPNVAGVQEVKARLHFSVCLWLQANTDVGLPVQAIMSQPLLHLELVIVTTGSCMRMGDEQTQQSNTASGMS